MSAIIVQGTSSDMQVASPQEIFDRRRRCAMRERGAHRKGAGHFLWELLADDLIDRLNCTTRQFDRALILGPLAGQAEETWGGKAADLVSLPFAEEDRLGIDSGSFDLVIAAGTLDSVNDLPGALVQIRRALRPDGLFLGAMFGAGTLASLKRAMMIADGDRTSAHVHPQIELRTAADLLARAGFALQVADKVETNVHYGDWRTLIADLRDAGIGNSLAGPKPYLGSSYPARLDAAWATLRNANGKVRERFEFLHLSGWAPSPDQPKPAARGSGKVSLTSVFEKTGKNLRP
ncbi:methyltransferase domain-containing protein [Sphingorhabdus sp.]|uniref:methyltransferase domain-containing protein n=1 Tax=Sphingorhabdus sp. TaxID=1902408 RepID=UPI0032B865C1